MRKIPVLRYLSTMLNKLSINTPQVLLTELAKLHKQLKKLNKEKSQLEISLEIITEHADSLEAALYQMQEDLSRKVEYQSLELQEKQILLQKEISAKNQLTSELNSLCQQVDILSKNKAKLEISLEMITEHADLFEIQLVEAQNCLEKKVAERTQELEEKNHQLRAEIQERSRAEAELLQAKESAEQARVSAEMANRAKSVFLAKMSHELRTPLNAILGYSDIIAEDILVKGYHDILPDLQNVKLAGESLLTLVSDLLDISKIETEKIELYPTEFDLSELINRVITIIYPTLKDNQLTVNCPDDLGKMFADATRVQQILQNLLSNAVKFTSHGNINLLVESDQHFITFRVRDTGIGIPSEKITTIFDAFDQVDSSSTRKYQGTGIGLTICKQLSQAMSGNISVESELGKGSVFTVRLPRNIQLKHITKDNI